MQPHTHWVKRDATEATVAGYLFTKRSREIETFLCVCETERELPYGRTKWYSIDR